MTDIDDAHALIEGGVVEGEDVAAGQGEQLIDPELPQRRHRQAAAVT